MKSYFMSRAINISIKMYKVVISAHFSLTFSLKLDEKLIKRQFIENRLIAVVSSYKMKLNTSRITAAVSLSVVNSQFVAQ